MCDRLIHRSRKLKIEATQSFHKKMHKNRLRSNMGSYGDKGTT
jgi:hypothetical protein